VLILSRACSKPGKRGKKKVKANLSNPDFLMRISFTEEESPIATPSSGGVRKGEKRKNSLFPYIPVTILGKGKSF